MKSLLYVFGRSVERRAIVSGALVSLAAAVGIGVVAGSLIDERTKGAYIVNGLLFAGLMAGGAIAAAKSRQNPLLAATLTSGPVMVLAVIVQLIRRFGAGEAVAPLGLPLVMALSVSLATLGGLVGIRLGRRRQSLLDPTERPDTSLGL
ncbi:hypothetical protein [Candidatus Poriferisodalis sp.]|uniref:hypothetical protein n=1 Tax=Candidatus Poriferisodalis sp. TaxID=3101277 RepID=UPI003B020C30